MFMRLKARGATRTRLQGSPGGVFEARLRVAQQSGPYAWPYASLRRAFVDQELDPALGGARRRSRCSAFEAR